MHDALHEPIQDRMRFGRLLAIGFALALHYGVQGLTSLLAVYPYLGLRRDVAYYGSWIQLSEHHLWQLALSLLIIWRLGRGNWAAWGLNLNNMGRSLAILWRFCLIYGCVGIGLVLYRTGGTRPTFGYPLTEANVVGWLGFEWLLSGLSEETLFRGLIHSYLRQFWPATWRWGTIDMPVAGFITALIFTLAHVNFRLFPFGVTHLSGPQLLTAFGLGLYYSAVYHKTGSLLNPILAHNFSNGIVFLTRYTLAWAM